MNVQIVKRKSAVEQTTAHEPLYNDSLSKYHYTKKPNKCLCLGGFFI